MTPGRASRRRPLVRRALVAAGALAVVAAAYLALRHAHPGRVVHTLGTVAIGWVLLAALVDAVSLLTRAISWRFVLRAALDEPSPPMAAIARATLIGVFASAVVPGRVGEAARAWLVARRLDQPRRALPVVLGTVLAQTILNLVALAILGALTFSSLSVFRGNGGALAAAAAVPVAVAAIILGGPRALAAARRAPWERLRVPAAWTQRQLTRARQGMRMFADIRDGPPAAVLQLAAWALQALACWLVLLGLHLRPPATVLTAAAVLLAVNVTAAVPVTPSNVGVFQAACIAVLAAYGIGAGAGLAYGLVLQAVEVVVAVALGVPALLGEGVTWNQLRDAGEEIEHDAMTTPPDDAEP